MFGRHILYQSELPLSPSLLKMEEVQGWMEASSLAICTTEMYLYVYGENVCFLSIFADIFRSPWPFPTVASALCLLVASC